MAKTKRKDRNYIFVIGLVALVLVIFILNFFFRTVVLKEMNLPVKFEVSNITGINVDENLDFGRIIHGSNGQKSIDLKNNYNFPIAVEFSADSNISRYLVYEETVYLKPGEMKVAKISTIVFENESYGKYSGTMNVVFKKSR